MEAMTNARITVGLLHLSVVPPHGALDLARAVATLEPVGLG